MNAFRSATFMGLVAGAALAGSGCDDASNSTSSNQNQGQQVQLSGTVVDGYVAGARVWLDVNNNHQIDTFEPVARTDRYGFFSSRPKLVDGDGGEIAEEREYCDSSKPYYDDGRYCLRATENTGNEGNKATLRMVGGYDLLTGERFEGSMSRKIAIAGDGEGLVVSPLTSILVDDSDNVEHADVWGSNYWIGDEDGSDRYVWQSDSVKTEELEAALSLHKVVDVITAGIFDLLEEEYGLSADSETIEDIFGVDPSMEVYRQLREELDLDSGALDLGDIDLTSEVIEDSLSGIIDKIEAHEDIDYSLGDDIWKEILADLAEELHDAIEEAFDNGNGGASPANDTNPRATSRAVEVATIVARKDAEYMNARAGVSNASASSSAANSDNRYSGIIGNVSDAITDNGENLDVGSVADAINEDPNANIGDAVTNSTVEAKLPELTGTVLSLNAQAEDNDEVQEAQAAIAFYFQPGEGEDIPESDGESLAGWYSDGDNDDYKGSGKLTACLSTSGDIDFNLDQEVVHLEGSWERLSDRSLLLNVDFAGEPQTLNLRVRGSSNAAALEQYYTRDNWDGNGKWDGNGNGSDITRDNFWRKFSNDYWGDGDEKDTYLGSDVDGRSGGRFDVYDDYDDSDNKNRDDNYEDEGLTPRGWVFDLDYEGDKDKWDVEETRDDMLVNEGNNQDADATLKLFTPYGSSSSVPENSDGCAELTSDDGE